MSYVLPQPSVRSPGVYETFISLGLGFWSLITPTPIYMYSVSHDFLLIMNTSENVKLNYDDNDTTRPILQYEDVTDLRIEVGLELHTAKTKHVVVCSRKLNS